MLSRVFFLISVLVTFSAVAQHVRGKALSLQQCVELAITNNVQAKQRSLLVETAKVDYNQSKMNLLPSLNSSISHGINQGRSIDPFTNGYVNQQINYASYAIGSSLVLFNGSNL